MPSNVADRVRDGEALMLAMKLFAETLFSELKLEPGESMRVGDYMVTAPQAARFAPFIVPLKRKVETAA